MKNDHHSGRSVGDDGMRSNATTTDLPGGPGQKEQEPARVRRASTGSETRSDTEIRVALDALLGSSDAFGAAGVELLVTDGVVVILGRVPDYRTKRELEAAVAAVPGVHEIHDQLQVSW
jgi:osmotically-inducible protein OsmY